MQKSFLIAAASVLVLSGAGCEMVKEGAQNDQALLEEVVERLRQEESPELSDLFDPRTSRESVEIMEIAPREDRAKIADAIAASQLVETNGDVSTYYVMITDPTGSPYSGNFWIVTVDGEQRLRFAPPE